MDEYRRLRHSPRLVFFFSFSFLAGKTSRTVGAIGGKKRCCLFVVCFYFIVNLTTQQFANSFLALSSVGRGTGSWRVEAGGYQREFGVRLVEQLARLEVRKGVVCLLFVSIYCQFDDTTVC